MKETEKKEQHTNQKSISIEKKHGSYLWLDFLPTLSSSHELLVTVVLSALMKRPSQRGQKSVDQPKMFLTHKENEAGNFTQQRRHNNT